VTIYTIGHSTRSFAEFLALLQAHRIDRVADIRTVPRSRRHPHFSREVLKGALAEHGIAYEHFAELGGLRRPRPDSPNTGWRNESFRGYADHMRSADFSSGVDRVLAFSAEGRTSVMCAEAVWWRCHRGLLADALLLRGVTVCHILTISPAQPHQLCDFARTEGTTITYQEDTGRSSRIGGNQKPRGTV
jgi:uncharacterized protein (DUF488 family)